MRSIWKFVFVALVTFGASQTTGAAEVAVCGASEGYAFFPKTGLLAGAPDAGRWEEDRIGQGRLTLSLLEGGELDLLFSDASGSVNSARNDGGSVHMLGVSKTSISVLVIYPETTAETYTFYQNAAGELWVIWTQNKFGAAISKVAANRAPCSSISF